MTECKNCGLWWSTKIHDKCQNCGFPPIEEWIVTDLREKLGKTLRIIGEKLE